MTSREVDQMAGVQQAVVERFYAAFNSGDFESVVACFSPDVETTDPGLGTVRDVGAWRAYVVAFKRALPDARLNLMTALEAGEIVAIEGRFTGTFTATLTTPQGEVSPTGRSIDVPYADFFTVRDERIVAHRVYYDQVQLGTQLGLMPAGA
jgi:steroid delta-isomerase-like uncharacterized protein